MATFFEQKDRRVIPNWRSFVNTIQLRELEFPKIIEVAKTPPNISGYIQDWENNKAIPFAADLLSAAIVNNSIDEPAVKEAARFVLMNKETTTKSQISLATYINEGAGNNNNNSNHFSDILLENLHLLVNREQVVPKITQLKELIRTYPFNPIYYVEISRLYSILGQEMQSIGAMKTALHLAPNNRYILRCAARLFAHFNCFDNGYLEFIHNYLRTSPLTIQDPWLLSAEIAIANLRNRSSRFINKGLEIIRSRDYKPYSFTELASSIGTIELLNGKHKKSRELFAQALLSPNDNSLAQIEWASSKDRLIEVNLLSYNVKRNFEALALDCYWNNQYDKSIEYIAYWYYDMPFSKRPIMLGSHIASTFLKDNEKSLLFLKLGLISHPNDPQILNNLAYTYCLSDQPDKAFYYLNQVKSSTECDDVTAICLIATQGLACFRSGNPDEGRQYYLSAIERTKDIQNQELNWIAILNYAREEILIKSEVIEEIMEVVNKIPDINSDIEINYLKQDVVNLYKSFKGSMEK